MTTEQTYRIVAWIDGVHYAVKPVAHIRSNGVTPCGRDWLMGKGHPVIHVLPAYRSNI